jgi:hypothetical protein
MFTKTDNASRRGGGVGVSLPPFTAEGLLPPGDYPLTLDELARSHLVNGTSAGSTTWDSAWRAELVRNLGVMVAQLWHVGLDTIFVDGSFVEAKDHPNDIDGYFVCDRLYVTSGLLERDLNALDRHRCWTWDTAQRRWDAGSGKSQLPLWFVYHVELYPHFGQGTGVFDQYGQELVFPSLFRQSRYSAQEKGIVRVVR